MFLSVGHEKNVIYSKLVNNPFKGLMSCSDGDWIGDSGWVWEKGGSHPQQSPTAPRLRGCEYCLYIN